MKIKFLVCFVLLSVTTVFAQDKLEIFFDSNEYQITATTANRLKVWVAANKKAEISKICGFCDSKGSNPYNDTLSMKRVNAVSEFLKSQQLIIKGDLEIRGFGEDFKQSKIASENRKVVVLYDPKIKKPAISEASIALQEKIKKSKPGDKIKLENINFYNSSSRILPESQKNLDGLLQIMRENPKLKIEIQGHICCEREDVNEVSISRARAIYYFLIGKKIDKERLSYKGLGSKEPIYPLPEKNEGERNENRRVEIAIVEN